MTVPTTSWSATTAPRLKRCFSTSHGAAPGRGRDEPPRPISGHCPASHRCDDPALLVPLDVVVAPAPGTAVLAGAADHHLGLPAELHRAECRVFRSRRWHADRGGDPVGHPVP